MRQNIQRLLLRPEIAGHNVVVIVCRLKPILLHQSFCRCNYLSRAVTKRLSFLRPATLTVDPYEHLQILDHLVLFAVDICIYFFSVHVCSPFPPLPVLL